MWTPTFSVIINAKSGCRGDNLIVMIYTLFLKHGEKDYSISQNYQGTANSNQYEAVALGLLLQKIEEERLPRDDFYQKLVLLEQADVAHESHKVWGVESYYPNSIKVE